MCLKNTWNVSANLKVSVTKIAFLFGLVVTVYLSLNLLMPQGLMAYLVPAICWGLVALGAIFICGPKNIEVWFSQNVVFTAFLIGVSQIIVLVFVSFFAGFGKSPYQFTPSAIVLNTTYFMSMLLAFEFSRAYFIKSTSKRKVTMAIVLIGLFYTLMRLPTGSFLTLGAPSDTLKFLGSSVLPTLAQSIFATLLALFGGPIASIAYLGTLDAVQWLSPILPNPGWTTMALIGTLIPAIGLLTIVQTTSPFALIRNGILTKSEARHNASKTKKSFPLTWIVIVLVGVMLVWGSTGLLGFRPSVVASGSMTPSLNVGDLAITVPANLQTIKHGDIIQYLRNNEFIMHRVVGVESINGATFFITKGDANNVLDAPVSQDAVTGKVLYIIPKLGWVSIYLKTTAETSFNFLSKNLSIALTTIVLAIATLSFPVYRYENRPLRRLKRRR